jgi:hypothetical protein
MELSVCDVTTANPSADAIMRAVYATPHPEDCGHVLPDSERPARS